MKSNNQPYFEVSGLHVKASADAVGTPILQDIHFHIAQGETLAIVGESGCGKSTLALAVMGLLDKPLHIQAGRIRLVDQDLTTLNEKELSKVRGSQISMVFQDPLSAFHPMISLGAQMMECLKEGSRSIRRTRCLEMLDRVGLPDPKKHMKSYSFELSGGMLQRVMIAMALLNRPKLFIADEPTTALDVTVQAGILSLLKDIQREFGMGMLFISHDLGVVSDIADRIIVMHDGRIVEEGQAARLLTEPDHAYTKHLLEMMPVMGRRLPDEVLSYEQHVMQLEIERGVMNASSSQYS